MYIKSQSTLQQNTYTIPVIPGDGTIIKRLQYLTADQMLSTGKLYITPSTIPDILSSINSLSSLQLTILNSISTLSTSVGKNVSSLKGANDTFSNAVFAQTYGDSYAALLVSYNQIQAQNIETLRLQGIVLSLGVSISSISSQIAPSF
jgi:hypothetical protein